MSTIATLRRKAYTAALLGFRHLPAVIRRNLVRAGTPGYTVGAVCAIEHQGHVLFLRQPHRRGWSLPGGLLDRGESSADGVVREIYEETRLLVSVGEPVATQVHPDVRRVDVIYRIGVEERPDVVVGGEAKSFRWMRPQEVPEVDEATERILQVIDRPRDASEQRGRVLGTSR